MMLFRRWSACAAVVALALTAALPARPAAAQGGTGTVRGRITSGASGAPISAAQVFIVGTKAGTLSGPDGNYSITGAPLGAQTVRVRALGYQPADRAVTVTAAGARVDLTLTTAVVALNEVVVTGTAGAARMREVGNSIGSVKTSEAQSVPTDVSSMLSGQMAGVSVTGGSGNAGAGSAIRLRGMTSVALTNQPLIYIDGVRLRSDEYPKNVSSQGGQNLRSGNVNSSPMNDINPDDIERIEVVKGAAAATLYGTDAAAGVIQIFTKRGAAGAAKWTAQLTSGFNHEQKFGTSAAPYLFMNPWLRDGRRNGAAISVSGGTTGNTRYFLSFAGDNNDGVMPLDNERKYNLRANFDFSPLKNLAVSWNSSYTNNLLSNTPAGNNAAGLTLNAFRRDRNYFGDSTVSVINQVLVYQLNTYIDRLILGATATWTPLTALSSRATLGLDRAAVENRNLRPYGFVSAPLGIISDVRWQNLTLSFDWANNFEHTFKGDVRSTTSFGTQYVSSNVSSAEAYGETFPGPGVPTVSSASVKSAFETRQTIITGGGFLQELLGWKDRYFLTAGLRIDGNSAFGKNFGLQKYPKASASWVASEEKFWKWPSSTLKVRAAYGEAGRAPGAFDAVQTWNPVGWGGQPAFRPLNVGNANLGPERTKEVEFGFDLTAFDGRGNITYTLFDATTSDALFPVRQIPSNGFGGSQLQNVGKMAKGGIELTISGTPIDRKYFTLNASLSLTTNHTQVLSLGGAPSFSVGNFGWVIEGQQVPILRGKKIANHDVLGAIPDTVPNYLFGPSQPTKIIGGSLSVKTWKGIMVSLRGEYQAGAYIDEDASFQALQRSVKWPTCFSAYDRIAANQPITAWEKATCTPSTVKQDMFIFPADFFKLRDLTVTVPLGKLIPGTTGSTFVFTAQNFFRRNYGMPMFDPEQSGNDGFNAPVRYISEHIPAPATFLTSLRIAF
jgi:TonB-dependent SusC/RagA subfamily outer membrane receptor